MILIIDHIFIRVFPLGLVARLVDHMHVIYSHLFQNYLSIQMSVLQSYTHALHCHSSVQECLSGFKHFSQVLSENGSCSDWWPQSNQGNIQNGGTMWKAWTFSKIKCSADLWIKELHKLKSKYDTCISRLF